MEYHPIIPISQGSMWMMKLRPSETMNSESYPQRPGEPDCSYYIKTGLCRFGSTCRFNHPPNRKLAIVSARTIGEFPERIGQPECQYYMKTGTCKFGVTCKFHHPRDQAEISGRVALNTLGYPLRPNEAECSYYLRTGECQFGNTCKFHHPQPSNMMLSLRSSPIYPTLHSPTSSYLPSSYTPLIMPGWSAYSGQMGSMISTPPASPLQRGNIFPERPGQPECQFYMKTGDCKFGAGCRFHHPRQRLLIPASPDCLLSPMGLPLRPGEPMCVFYSRYGICKFGPSCKFNHPMGIFSYNISASPSVDDATDRRLLGSSSATATLLEESSSSKPTRLSISETRQVPSDDDDDDDDIDEDR
ncbi:zinc finger CCCH domain-containing protein zfn-like [Trifolium pratense]|uniref:Zinc finger CCCH domain-containing protein zfn-like n=1 Tax=Trifolium pratense TaxID=57577 RepID=A0A2K3MQ15_TRIPR|nr:zinc finger CCCH domain-containing protein zfn-like [Trifolium pratense]